jgi:ABC-type amino acid transport substrate-binding protein
MRNFLRLAVLATLCFSSATFCTSASALADDEKVGPAGILKVAVYNDFAPFSANGVGIDVDLARALAKKLGLKLSLLQFKAGEDLNDDLRNMVWKGHYLGYGPADVMLHVPVDRRLMAANDQVQIFAPYYHDTVRLVRSTKTVPSFDNLDSLLGKKIGVEGDSISATVLLGEQNGKFRDDVKIYTSAIEALEKLKAGELDAVLASRSEIEFVLKSNPDYPLEEVSFSRLPRQGWVVGMAVKKDEVDLAKQLQTATNELFESGEMAKIFSQYGVQVVKP